MNTNIGDPRIVRKLDYSHYYLARMELNYAVKSIVHRLCNDCRHHAVMSPCRHKQCLVYKLNAFMERGYT